MQRKTSPRGAAKRGEEKGGSKRGSGGPEREGKEGLPNKPLVEMVNEDSNMSQASQCSQASSTQGEPCVQGIRAMSCTAQMIQMGEMLNFLKR